MSSGMILTTAGRNLLALALTGKELVFTRAFVGDGSLRTGQDPASLSALISPKRELPIQSMSVTGSVGTAEVVLEMTNKGLTTGFFVREYGLFARHPDTGSEVLYSYRNTGSESGYLEGDNGVDIIAYTLSLVTVIDQAPNVTAYITNTNQYVTVSRMEQRVMDLYAPYTSPAGFWTLSPLSDQRIRPATLEQTREVILQGVDVAGLNGRLERVEDALAQTMLQLEMLQDFPGYSHFIAEDFKNTSMLDMFSSEVTSIVAGDDSIDVTPIEGMLPGSYYTLTDGISAEIVQVESINLENEVQRVILTAPVKNTYILDATVLYRTSARLDSETAIGPNARMIRTWTPDIEWKGTGASEDFTVDLGLSVKDFVGYVANTPSVTVDEHGLVGLGG